MKKFVRHLIAAWFALFFIHSYGVAGEADVIEVKVDKKAAGIYDIEVTVQHSDEGWNHYADKWDVLDEKGTVLATRVLHHPHVDEQPFTRGLSGVKIVEGTATISMRAHDSVHGYGGRTVTVDLP
ncbi:MAG: hypothetical protein KJN87_07575 [Desulfofustis sp.]|nr:hypothetical protein [Desulfofustis sp.]